MLKKQNKQQTQLNEFIEYMKSYLSNNTVIARSYDLKDYFRQYNIIDNNSIQKYVSSMNRNKLDSKTIARRVGSLKAFADYLGIPLSKINKPGITRKLPQVLSSGELRRLSKSITDICIDDDFNLITLKPMFVLLNTTARIGEILALKETDIDFGEKLIRYKGKRNKETIKPIVWGVNLIKEYIELKNKLGIDVDNLLVRKYNNIWKPLQEREFRLELSGFCERIVENKHVYPHMFRHTIATELLNNGAGIRDVQEVLGHESMATTQFYTHVAKGRLRGVLESNHPLS